MSDFLNLKKQENKPREGLIDEWKSQLDNLFGKICTWAEEYDAGIETKKTSKTIDEPDLGTYKAPVLILKNSEQEIKFEPFGRIIIGGQGRIDVDLPEEKLKLICWEDNGGWNLVNDVRISGIQFDYDKELFTKTVFFNLINETFD